MFLQNGLINHFHIVGTGLELACNGSSYGDHHTKQLYYTSVTFERTSAFPAIIHWTYIERNWTLPLGLFRTSFTNFPIEWDRTLYKAPQAAAISPFLISSDPYMGRQTTTPGTTCPTLFDKCVGSLTSPADHVTLKMQEKGPTVYTYPRRLECLTIWRYNYKGGTFSSVILRPWMLDRSGARTLDLPHSRLMPYQELLELLQRNSSTSIWEYKNCTYEKRLPNQGWQKAIIFNYSLMVLDIQLRFTVLLLASLFIFTF